MPLKHNGTLGCDVLTASRHSALLIGLALGGQLLIPSLALQTTMLLRVHESFFLKEWHLPVGGKLLTVALRFPRQLLATSRINGGEV